MCIGNAQGSKDLAKLHFLVNRLLIHFPRYLTLEILNEIPVHNTGRSVFLSER